MLIKVLPLVFLTLSWISTKKTRAFFLWGTVLDPGLTAIVMKFAFLPAQASAFCSPHQKWPQPGDQNCFGFIDSKNNWGTHGRGLSYRGGAQIRHIPCLQGLHSLKSVKAVMTIDTKLLTSWILSKRQRSLRGCKVEGNCRISWGIRVSLRPPDVVSQTLGLGDTAAKSWACGSEGRHEKFKY